MQIMFAGLALLTLSGQLARAQLPTYHVGRAPTAQEIKEQDTYVGPSGEGLPQGHGTAKEGAKIFAQNCTSCHGDTGKGNQELGAPNLTDKIWLYGSDETSLVETITNGRAGVMPAWVGRLDSATIKAMAVYVHSLGGGK